MEAMYVCQECKSTEFEKVNGFLYCLVCQVQQKDYIEYAIDDDVDDDTELWSQESRRRDTGRRKLQERKKLIENWTAWDAYNHILLGFIKELCDTGLAPTELKPSVMSIWLGYVEKCMELAKKSQKKQSVKRKLSKTSVNKSTNKNSSSQNSSLEEDLEQLHIDKKRKINNTKTNNNDDDDDDDDDDDLIFTPMSQPCTSSFRQIQRRMIERHYHDVMDSEIGMDDILEHETIETIGRHSEDDPNSAFNQATETLRYPSTSEHDIKQPEEKMRPKKLVPICKGRAFEMVHLGLLMCSSDIQLSDLLRFVREGHIAYAKVTHFLPPEIKLTTENYSYLETVRDKCMPTHIQMRKLGADVAKMLGIEELPVPNMSRLIKRYVAELRLPARIRYYAQMMCKVADVESLCSFKRAKKRIPNYEGMAAASIILALKFLFGLDDRTEFLISDFAKKTNKCLKQRTTSDSCKLFNFQEWKKFIELRNTYLSMKHYPTQERLNRYTSASGFLQMLAKESKDPHREKRFETYNQYHMNSELLGVCMETLQNLIKPTKLHTMEFPATLKPMTTYLDTMIQDYTEVVNGNPEARYESADFPPFTDFVLTLFVKHYERRQVYFMHNPEPYKDMLRDNGYKIRTVSKRDQIKLMAAENCGEDNRGNERRANEEDGGNDGGNSDEDERSNGDSGTEVRSDDAETDVENSYVESDTQMDGDEEAVSQNEEQAEKMDVNEEEKETIAEPSTGEAKQPDEEDEEEDHGDGLKWRSIIVTEGEKKFTYYVAKPETLSYKKIEKMPKRKYKETNWTNIRYKALSSSKKVFIVKHMPTTWKLDSPWLSEDSQNIFSMSVFKKTPHNFQWIVCEMASMLEMKVRELYIECYRLEVALEKAKKIPLSHIKARIKQIFAK